MPTIFYLATQTITIGGGKPEVFFYIYNGCDPSHLHNIENHPFLQDSFYAIKTRAAALVFLFDISNFLSYCRIRRFVLPLPDRLP